MRDPTVAMSGRGARWGRRRRRRRRIIIVVVVSVLVLALAAGGAGYLLLRTAGSPQQTAAAYLQAWQKGDYPAMGRVSVGVPQGGLAGPLQQAAAQLGMRHIHLVLGQVTPNGGTASARFTASADLASGHVWTYPGQLALGRRRPARRVSQAPA